MKRRREIGPKRQKNRTALIKFLLWALVAAVVGSTLTYLCYRLFGSTPLEPAASEAGPEAKNAGSLLSWIHTMLLAATIITVLALVFFGIRAYLMGIKARFTLQSGRMKIKRS